MSHKHTPTLRLHSSLTLLAASLAPLFLFLLVSRLALLNKVPAMLPHDELIYAVQARSYVVQGTTLEQNHFPWQLSSFDRMYAELPATLMSIGFVFSADPLVASHLLSALMGITLPFLVGWLVWMLWAKRTVAYSALVISAFNPILWQMSRLGYDALYSLWLYVLGACFLLQQKVWLRWLSLPVFVLGFFNYQGFKLLLVPWLIFLLGTLISRSVEWSSAKTMVRTTIKHAAKHKLLVVVLLLSVMLTAWYGLVSLPSQSGVATRLQRTIFTDTERLADAINTARRQTIESPFTPVVYNKATEIISFLGSRVVGVFNPLLLFILVEPAVSGFTVWTHGLFYWIEGLLMLAGVYMLLSRKATRVTGLWLLLSTLMVSAPALINSGSEWYVLRSMLTYLLLVMLASWGLAWVWRKRYLRWAVVGLYVIAIGNFTFQYFFRYPLISLDWGNYDERVLARYLALQKEQDPSTPISVVVVQPDYFFWAYLLYSGLISADTVDAIGETSRAARATDMLTFRYDNILFTGDCALADPNGVMIGGVSMKKCLTEQQASSSAAVVTPETLSITAVLDSGERLALFNDRLCQGLELPRFANPRRLEDLQVETMTREEFCQMWVANQNFDSNE